MELSSKIRDYLHEINEHHRYRSWEHCYGFFRKVGPDGAAKDINDAAIRLGFYLASWGMYRGSSFLLQHAYTVHLGVIKRLTSADFLPLWVEEVGASDHDFQLSPLLLQASAAVREAYRPFAPASEARQASDTLVTKVLLGMFGCIPACDRNFIAGFKSTGFQYSYLNAAFIERIMEFGHKNLAELKAEQRRIAELNHVHYPVMKLIDMYFWEVGFELELASKAKGGSAS